MFITALHGYNPEDDEDGMRIFPAYIADKLNSIRSILVWKEMGISGAAT